MQNQFLFYDTKGVVALILIGEKINGAIPAVAAAIKDKNADIIRNLAIMQTDAGADYLDICAGTEPQLEYDTLKWLLDVVQSVTELPLCIDSPNPEMLLKVIPLVNKPGIINSVSGEGNKCETIYPFLKENPEWKVIALTCDDNGIPVEAEKKIEIARRLIKKASEYDITSDRIFIDPLVLALTAVNDATVQFMNTIRNIKAEYPSVRFTSGLSNISYGMPARGLINRTFMTLALSAGMDSAIIDPLSKPIMETLYATEALLGKDRLCRNFNKAYRAGKIGTKKAD